MWRTVGARMYEWLELLCGSIQNLKKKKKVIVDVIKDFCVSSTIQI